MSSVFNLCAPFYKQEARVSDEIGLRLLERLDYFKLSPNYILDLGAGVGRFSKALKRRYPKAVIVSLDLAFEMTQRARKQQRFIQRWPVVCADMHVLPFQNKQFDLIFSNQVLQWSFSLGDVFSELHRVMRPQGCFLFSMLGPDTLKELSGFSECTPVMPSMIDMHHIGDAMIQTGFDDPVLDMEMLTVNYRKFETLRSSLQTQGISCAQIQDMASEIQPHALSFEVLYGHGWRLQDKQKTVGSETFVPLHMLTSKKEA